MREVHRRILASLAIVATIAVVGLTANQYSSTEWLVSREAVLRAYVHAYPLRAWLVGFWIYSCLSLIPGTSGKSIIFGWLFGFWRAVLLVDFALTTAAMVSFTVSRFLFRAPIEARFGEHIIRFRKRIRTGTAFSMLMLRLLHTPFSFVNYGAGATNIVSTRTFWWTTQLGLLPGTMVFVFAGTRIPSLAIIAERGVAAIFDPLLFLVLILTAFLPILGRICVNAIQRRSA